MMIQYIILLNLTKAKKRIVANADGQFCAHLCSSSTERVDERVITSFSPGVLAHTGSVSAAPQLCVAGMPIFKLLIYI